MVFVGGIPERFAAILFKIILLVINITLQLLIIYYMHSLSFDLLYQFGQIAFVSSFLWDCHAVVLHGLDSSSDNLKINGMTILYIVK